MVIFILSSTSCDTTTMDKQIQTLKQLKIGCNIRIIHSLYGSNKTICYGLLQAGMLEADVRVAKSDGGDIGGTWL